MVEVFATHPTFHLFLLKLVQKTERIDLLDNMYETAISRLDSAEGYAQLCHVRYAYGSALHGISGRHADAIRQWETAIQSDLLRGNNNYILPRLISRLAPIYVDKAERAEDPSPHLDAISALVPDGISETASFVGPQIYLARYWYSQGNRAQAKRMVRDRVRQAIDLLSDEDEGNDAFAFQRLLSVFVPLGDNKNTTVCVRMLARIGGLLQCDGDCGQTWDFGEAMWWCRDCVNMNFNRECYQKLCEGEFKFNVCHRGHEFFYIKVGEQKTNGEAVEDLVDEKWIDEIRREYLSRQ